MSQEDMNPKDSENLCIEIRDFKLSMSKRYNKNIYFTYLLKVGVLLLSAGVTLSGLFNQGTYAAILGVLIGLFIGLQDTFNFDIKAKYYKTMHLEIAELLTKLETGSDIKEIIEKFYKLRKEEANYQPKE